MEYELEQKLVALETKVEAVYQSVEKMRKYIQIVTWITIAMVVLPLLGLLFAVPVFIRTYLGAFEGL